MLICDNRTIQIKEHYNVVIVGGGIAGVSAAVSASRNGLKTLLIEKQINLGGLATTGLINWYEPLCDGCGKQMIFGIAEELIKLSVKYSFDTLPEQWGGSEKDEQQTRRYATTFSPTVFTLALDEYVLSNGVSLRFDTMVVSPVVERNKCIGVICESVSGREFFGCDIVIDATGDASVAQRAGVPTVIGENFMTYVAHGFDKESAQGLINTGDICNFRKWKVVGSNMFGEGHPDGLRKLKGGSAEDVTDYVIYGKSRLLEMCKTYDRNSYDIMMLPTMPQFRTIRRIVGKTDFTAVDRKSYTDSIGICGDFRPNGRGKQYEIPYGALYNENFDNILVCGRIISAPEGDGWEVSRVIPTCALTGQAAGNAAALAIKSSCRVSEIDISKLQEKQKESGICINN